MLFMVHGGRHLPSDGGGEGAADGEPRAEAAKRPAPKWPCETWHSHTPRRADATEADMEFMNDLNKQREDLYLDKVRAREAAAAAKN